MSQETFVVMLTGGHPNSLGRTIEVVDMVLAQSDLIEDLYQCYFDDDAIVRLRVSNAFKRIWRAHPAWVVPYIDRFIIEIALIKQASTQWTIAQLFDELDAYMSDEQREQAMAILKRNLLEWDDWIVLNNTVQALGKWAQHDEALAQWLMPILEERTHDSRKSVAKTASKVLATLA